jgi:hypothetical protein
MAGVITPAQYAEGGGGSSGYPAQPAVTGTASAGEVLTAQSATAASYQPSTGGPPSGTAGGALGGSYPDPLVGLTPSGDATGVTDTANIQGLLNLSNIAYLQLAVYYVNAPVLVAAGGLIKGAKGCGPSIYDEIAAPLSGTILRAVAAWSAGAVTTPAFVQIQGLGAHLRDFWIDGTANTVASIDGINDAGGSGYHSVNIKNVGVCNVTGNGIKQYGTEWNLFQCVANVCYSNGFAGSWVDSRLDGCFAQTCGYSGTGAGYYITGAQSKFVGCRGDVSQYGFFIDAGTAASYADMIQLTGCSTQRNNKDGIHIQNDGTSGRAPVVLSGCVFDGDGVNGTVTQVSGAAISGGIGGGGYASIHVSGACTVLVDGVSTTAATRDVAAGCPQYGLATSTVSGDGPNLISLEGVFLNAITAAINDAAPSALLGIGSNVYSYTGGVYLGSPATLPVQILPVALPAGFTPANPTATASTTLVMMGLGATCVYTPARTGKVLVTITCGWNTASGASVGNIGVRYGTGTAPVNGAAVTGSSTGFGGGATNSFQVKAAGIGSDIGMAFAGLLALTPNTQYWFDICTSTVTPGDVATVDGPAMTFVELVS